MEDSADIELYEEIVGNPAYSSSSDTSKPDPVSFQFREPRQTECRKEDFFARARSRPDPRIISHAVAGKNSQEPRPCDTFVECGSSRREFHDNSTILARTSNTSIFDTFATVSDVEPTHGTAVRDKCAILAPNVGPTSHISIPVSTRQVCDKPTRRTRISRLLLTQRDNFIRLTPHLMIPAGSDLRWT